MHGPDERPEADVGLATQHLTPAERRAYWVAAMERIREEHIDLAWSHYVLRLLREVFNANASLRDKGGFIIEATARMYATHTLMVLRRDLDSQANTENVRNLLYDLRDNATELTRASYLELWQGADEELVKLGSSQFDDWKPIRVEGDSSGDYIDPNEIEGHLDDLLEKLGRAREYAERLLAIALRRPRTQAHFCEMHEAMDELRTLINKYYVLLTASSMAKWEPVPPVQHSRPIHRGVGARRPGLHTCGRGPLARPTEALHPLRNLVICA